MIFIITCLTWAVKTNGTHKDCQKNKDNFLVNIQKIQNLMTIQTKKKPAK